MMDVFTVSFFGHRRLNNFLIVEQALEAMIRNWMSQKTYVEFLVGRNGEFDQLAASTVRRCKRVIRDDNSFLIWVMPYLTAEYRNNEKSFQDYYDEIEVCERSEESHYKAAFQIRNRDMVNRSDFIVFYVEHPSGGAYQTMCYARKQHKPMVNLALDSREFFLQKEE